MGFPAELFISVFVIKLNWLPQLPTACSHVFMQYYT